MPGLLGVGHTGLSTQCIANGLTRILPLPLSGPTQKGSTGLGGAALGGHEGVVRLLLEHKADPSGADQVCIKPESTYCNSVMVTVLLALNAVKHCQILFINLLCMFDCGIRLIGVCCYGVVSSH